MKLRMNIVMVCGCLLAACADAPEGIRATPEGGGPVVRFDLDHKPLPEIPFPNDLATRADATAATGRRVNASMIAPTALERKVREKIDETLGHHDPTVQRKVLYENAQRIYGIDLAGL